MSEYRFGNILAGILSSHCFCPDLGFLGLSRMWADTEGLSWSALLLLHRERPPRGTVPVCLVSGTRSGAWCRARGQPPALPASAPWTVPRAGLAGGWAVARVNDPGTWQPEAVAPASPLTEAGPGWSPPAWCCPWAWGRCRWSLPH